MKRIVALIALTAALPLAAFWLKTATAQVPAGGAPAPGGSVGPARPERFGQWVVSGGRAADPAMQAQQEALTEQENEAARLVAEYARLEDEKERGWVEGELTKVAAKSFDIRQEARDRELKELEAEVRKLRQLHQKRAKQKDQIVQDRVRQLLRDADGLGWGADENAPGSTAIPQQWNPNPFGRPGTQPGAANRPAQ